MARAPPQPAPEAAEKDAARALRVQAAVELRDLLRPPHAQARHEAALIGQQGEQAPAPAAGALTYSSAVSAERDERPVRP